MINTATSRSCTYKLVNVATGNDTFFCQIVKTDFKMNYSKSYKKEKSNHQNHIQIDSLFGFHIL